MSEQAISPPDTTTVNSVTAATTTSTTIDPDSTRLPMPVAPRDMFYTLTVYTPSKPQRPSDTEPPAPATSDHPTPADQPTDYDNAITRVKGLVGFLTPSMRCTLTSMLSVIQSHLLSPSQLGVATSTHALIARVASTEETPDLTIKDIVDTIEKGLQAFTALGGGSLPKSAVAAGGPNKRVKLDGTPFKSSHRSGKVRRECALRDGGSCQICNCVNPGEVVHIIPYSVKDSKGVDFWKFIELFHGLEATTALKQVALAPTPDSIDQLKNVWYLCKQCHSCFGGGKLAVIPDITRITYPYDSSQTTSYTAQIEFPAGSKGVSIARWKQDEDGDYNVDGKLCPGQEITLKTHDTFDLPLPHPLLFQLHAIISRVIALKAAAGFPLFPGFDRGIDDDERGVPAFTDITFEEWEAHHKKPSMPLDTANEHARRNRYDAPSSKSHIMRWFELTPHQTRHGPSASGSSDSGSDVDTLAQERDQSDANDEPPRKYSVVLSEVGQRMDEKWRIAEDRWMQLFEADSSSSSV